MLSRNPNLLRLSVAVVLVLLIILLGNRRTGLKDKDTHAQLFDNQRTSRSKEIIGRPKEVSIKDVAVFTYHAEKTWKHSTTCRSIARKLYLKDFFKIPFWTPTGEITVFVHDPKIDGVSFRAHSTKKFEPEILNLILLFLKSGSDINFIDIGANIGLHTVGVLKNGRKVISLEAVHNNVAHICATVHHLGFQNNVRIVHNAVGASHEPSRFHVGKIGTFGGGFVDSESSKVRQAKLKEEGDKYSNKAIVTPTVMLDDLFTMPDQNFFKTFMTNFIKIDVEGSELNVLRGAKKFLTRTKCVGIILEWRWHKGKPSAGMIVEILRSLEFEAYDPSSIKREFRQTRATMKELSRVFSAKLDYSKTAYWPHDVVWIQSKL